jgi:hypothetical protein
MDTAPALSPLAEAPPAGVDTVHPATSRRKKKGKRNRPLTTAPVPAKETRNKPARASAEVTRIQSEQPESTEDCSPSSPEEQTDPYLLRVKECDLLNDVLKLVFDAANDSKVTTEGALLLSVRIKEISDSIAAKTGACPRAE